MNAATLPSLQELLDKRTRLDPRKPPRKRHYLFCLFDGPEVVLIGTTVTPDARIVELEKGPRKFDAYTLLELDPDQIDDLLLELILTHKPRYNDRLPRNWKLVGKYKLKEQGINGHRINKAVRQKKLNPIHYNGLTYFLKSEAAEVFG